MANALPKLGRPWRTGGGSEPEQLQNHLHPGCQEPRWPWAQPVPAFPTCVPTVPVRPPPSLSLSPSTSPTATLGVVHCVPTWAVMVLLPYSIPPLPVGQTFRMQTLPTQAVPRTSLHSGILPEAHGFEERQLLALSPRKSVGQAVPYSETRSGVWTNPAPSQLLTSQKQSYSPWLVRITKPLFCCKLWSFQFH